MNYLGLFTALFCFWKFYVDLGKSISIRNVFAVLMCLQFLFGPFLVYNGFEEYQIYKMKVSEAEYFYYVTPAMICFLIGLYIKKNKRIINEYKNTKSLEIWYNLNPTVPMNFMIIGFVSTFIQKMVSGEFGFILYLLSNLKFIGLFLLLLVKTDIPIKSLFIIYSSIILSSFATGMFHDMFIWSIFFICVLTFKKHVKALVKLSLILGLLLAAIVIQTIKFDLREKLWVQGEELSIDLVEESYNSNVAKSGGLFSKENLAPQITRINQGWIIASIMDNVPKNVNFAGGELIGKYLESAILPRFIAPNKLDSGDKDIFNKYSGHFIDSGTSMGISSIGDAYIGFGIEGGWLFMLIYGLLFNLVINYFVKLSNFYPTAFVFSLLLLFYTVRPDCELQTTFGHLFKSSVLLFVLFRFFGRYFRIRSADEDNLQ
jgi:hypothetical protein